MTTELECRDAYKGDCEGDVEYVTDPYDGVRAFPRCTKHGDAWLEFLAETERKYGVHSDCPPEGFDSTYAGESWDED
jgi:hypothetical protein